MPHSTGVLVVSDDPGLSDEVGGWLEDAGLDVLLCPGPRSAACIGLSGRGCDLERAADLVVLDLRPSGNLFVDSSLRTKLTHHYSSCGKPVLVLTDDTGQPDQPGTVGAAILGRFAGRQQVTETVQDLMAQRRWPRERTTMES